MHGVFKYLARGQKAIFLVNKLLTRVQSFAHVEYAVITVYKDFSEESDTLLQRVFLTYNNYHLHLFALWAKRK